MASPPLAVPPQGMIVGELPSRPTRLSIGPHVLSEDRARATSFGDDPHQYDRSRPSYPSQLVDDLVEGGACDVVDVGCGTGIVARLLADRGCNVLGIEPDERMAAIAREHGIDVEVTRFEEWDPRRRTFDLLTSGQAWHWVDPKGGSTRAADVLRPGGRFAAFWNSLTHPVALMAAFALVYERLAPHLLEDSVALGTARPRRDDDRRALEHTGAFVGIDTREYRWMRNYTTDSWLEELPTHSGHRVLPPSVLDRLLVEVGAAVDAVGGQFVVEYRTHALFAIAR